MIVTRIIMVSGHVLAKALLPLEGAITLLACKFGSLMLGGHVKLKIVWSFAVLFTNSADISTSCRKAHSVIIETQFSVCEVTIVYIVPRNIYTQKYKTNFLQFNMLVLALLERTRSKNK